MTCMCDSYVDIVVHERTEMSVEDCVDCVDCLDEDEVVGRV